MTRRVTYECDLCHIAVASDDEDLIADWKELTDGRHLCDECVDTVNGILNAVE